MKIGENYVRVMSSRQSGKIKDSDKTLYENLVLYGDDEHITIYTIEPKVKGVYTIVPSKRFIEVNGKKRPYPVWKIGSLVEADEE